MPQGARADGTPWVTARIMVVDDDPDMVDYLSMLLHDAGYRNVFSATGGEEALEAVDDDALDLVLLDLNMPNPDGFEILDRLRRGPGGDAVPVVVLTANESVAARRRALQLGATDFLIKPCEPLELRQRVANLLQLRRLQMILAHDNDRLTGVVEAQDHELAAYRDVLDHVIDPVVVVDATSMRIAYANEAAARDTGLPIAELIGRSPQSVDALVASSVARPGVQRMLQGSQATCRLEAADTHGRHVDVVIQRVELTPGRPLLVAVAHDVEHVRQREHDLREALRLTGETVGRLRSVDDLRTNFVSAVSHEIRTPLTVVTGLASVLRDHGHELGSDRLVDIHERLAQHAMRLSGLLLDLLDVSLHEPSDISHQVETTRLDELVHSSLGRHGMGHHPISLVLGEVTADVSAQRVARSVDALLDNVLRHTPPDVPVRITVASSKGHAHILVEDGGPGVPFRERRRIFAPFVQAARSAHSPGTGIGLAAVDLCARLHGGAAWVGTSDLGGAAFHLELPQRQHASPGTPLAAAAG